MRYTIHTRSHTAPAPGYNPYPEVRYWVAEVRNENGETVYETPGHREKSAAVAEAQEVLSDIRSRQ